MDVYINGETMNMVLSLWAVGADSHKVSGSDQRFQGLLRIPLLAGSGHDANYRCEVPENVTKMLHLSPQCRFHVFLRYFAGNLLTHPTACTEVYLKLARRRMVQGGRTPTLGFRAWTRLLV